jgi:hypothetical protein
MTATVEDEPNLPVIPRPRSKSCPLAPPEEFVDWRPAPGLRTVLWQDRQDIYGIEELPTTLVIARRLAGSLTFPS